MARSLTRSYCRKYGGVYDLLRVEYDPSLLEGYQMHESEVERLWLGNSVGNSGAVGISDVDPHRSGAMTDHVHSMA